MTKNENKIVESQHLILNCYHCYNINQDSCICDAFYPEAIKNPRSKICSDFTLRTSGDIKAIDEFISKSNLSDKIIEKIATRIREEARKAFHEKQDQFGYGLAKAFSMLKSIVDWEFPQYRDLIENIEKKIGE